MDRERSSRLAVLDLDETLIEGSIGTMLAKKILDPRLNKGVVPRRYYLKAVRYLHLPILVKLKRIYRIYRYLLHTSYKLYLQLLRDEEVNRSRLKGLIAEALSEVRIPGISRSFVKRLKEKGYTTLLLTATPQEIAEVVGKKLGVDMVMGSRPGMVMDRENKERVLKELSRKGYRIEIVVGNPGNEPFWMAERLAIMVRSPKDLNKWLDRI